MANRKPVLIAIAAGVVVILAAGGIVWGVRSNSGGPRYDTVAAATGTVQETYSATAIVSRSDVKQVAFNQVGVVSAVNVHVSDTVKKGDVLATIDPTPAKLAVLSADATLAQAQSSLYAAQNPSAAIGQSAINQAALSALPSSVSTSGLSATQTSQLYQAIGAVVDAGAAWSSTVKGAKTPTSCDALYAEVAASSGTSGSSSQLSSADLASQAAAVGYTGSASDPSSIAAMQAAQQAAAMQAAQAAAATKQAGGAGLGQVSASQVKACGTARVRLAATLSVLAGEYGKLMTQGTGSSSSSTAQNALSAATSGVSQTAVSAAQAQVAQAQQAVNTANANLDAVSLTAPISGVVSAVGLTKSGLSTAGSITIVGQGAAQLSVELPYSARQYVTVGGKVTVTPPGLLTGIPATVSQISVIETAGTTGNPTYTTTVQAPDPDGNLVDGSQANVNFVVREVDNAVTVPISAVTPVGGNQGTVQVASSADASSSTTVNVVTGVSGGGKIQILSGLNAGDLVVLSDREASLPGLF